MAKKTMTVALAAAFVGGVGLTTSPANAAEPAPAPYCQGGPDTNRFGDPYYMYELNLGSTDRFDTSGDIKAAEHGGLQEVLWNGEQRALDSGDWLYLRYDDNGESGQWGVHPNTPTDGARINYTFGDGQQWTADVTSSKHGCEPQVEWTNEFLPYEPPAAVARPVASAEITSMVRKARVDVTATQPEGTVPTAKGAFYRVLKVNPRTQWQKTVGTGRVSEGSDDRIRVVFPKATKKMQVRVVSYGEVIAQRKVKMR